MANSTTTGHAQFISSKVGRRLFGMFILCAIIPVLCISAGSWLYVGNQLKTEAAKRLRQQCKNKGFFVYERLITLENELATIAKDYRAGHPVAMQSAPYNPLEREGSGWRRLFLWQPDGRISPLVEHLPNLPPLALAPQARPLENRTAIRVLHSDDISPTLVLLRPLDPSAPEKGTIGGDINPVYLWGIGSTGALLPGIEMTVLLPPQQILVSSIPDHLISGEFLVATAQEPFSGQYKSRTESETYINSYWSLFLKHRFDSPDWLIIFSQTRAAIMAPVNDFRLIFVLSILLTFWVILLFSIRTIRNKTEPVLALKTAALNIADGQLGYRVRVRSGDEFEILAEAFNEMSRKLQQNQALLLQAAKMSTFGQMSAGIVHEIGQPLAAISGYVELLQMSQLPDTEKRFVNTINREMERLAGIIAKFRSYSRVSEEVFTRVDLRTLLQRIEELIEHQLAMKQIRFETVLPEQALSIYGDASGLQQVLMNLITNAMDALTEKAAKPRHITVTARGEADRVFIEVADNGCGIPEEIQKSIFDPFFTTKGEAQGTGLGLAIIDSILHKHNGTITLESAPDQGTRFRLTFPESGPGADNDH